MAAAERELPQHATAARSAQHGQRTGLAEGVPREVERGEAGVRGEGARENEAGGRAGAVAGEGEAAQRGVGLQRAAERGNAGGAEGVAREVEGSEARAVREHRRDGESAALADPA